MLKRQRTRQAGHQPDRRGLGWLPAVTVEHVADKLIAVPVMLLQPVSTFHSAGQGRIAESEVTADQLRPVLGPVFRRIGPLPETAVRGHFPSLFQPPALDVVECKPLDGMADFMYQGLRPWKGIRGESQQVAFTDNAFATDMESGQVLVPVTVLGSLSTQPDGLGQVGQLSVSRIDADPQPGIDECLANAGTLEQQPP